MDPTEGNAENENGAGGEGTGSGEGAGGEPGPFAGLSENHAAIVAAKGWTGVGDLLDGYSNLEKLTGGGALPKPNLEDAAQRDKWEGWAALGVPGEAGGYEITPPEMAEGVQWDANLEAQAKNWGVELKLAPFQVQGLADRFAKFMGEASGFTSAVAGQTEETVKAELTKEYGSEYDAKLALGRQALAKLNSDLGEEDLNRLEALLGSSKLVKMMVTLGDQWKESGYISGDTGAGFGTELASVEAEIAKLNTDAEFQKAYTNKSDPGHRAAVDQMIALYDKKVKLSPS